MVCFSKGQDIMNLQFLIVCIFLKSVFGDSIVENTRDEKCKIKNSEDIHTVRELKDWKKRHLWSKTILITGIVGGAGMDPLTM